MKIRCKPGVNPAGAHPRLVSAVVQVASSIWQIADKECVITSMCDGVHGSRSFHYLLGAADFRSKHLTESEKDEVLADVREKLGADWDVLLEHRGGTNEHYHVEWDGGREQLMRYLGGLQDEFIADLQGAP